MPLSQQVSKEMLSSVQKVGTSERSLFTSVCEEDHRQSLPATAGLGMHHKLRCILSSTYKNDYS